MASILRVKEILKEKGKSVNDLANDMVINRVTLSNMINGNPTLETLKKIASCLEVEIKELFYSISKENYSVTKNETHNIFIYKDEHIWMQGNLPHFTNHDYGTFNIEVKRKGFSIVAKSKLVNELINEDKTIEEYIFMCNYQDEILIQLFSTNTSLRREEHLSFCNALKTYIYYHKEYYYNILKLLGADGYERIADSDCFKLCTIDLDIWNKLIELTYIYDIDSDKNDFEKFNATGKAITMYNQEIKRGYNSKTLITPLDKEPYGNQVTLGWKAPSKFDRNKILTNEIFTAKESYDFLHNVLIPKAKSLKKE